MLAKMAKNISTFHSGLEKLKYILNLQWEIKLGPYFKKTIYNMIFVFSDIENLG